MNRGESEASVRSRPQHYLHRSKVVFYPCIPRCENNACVYTVLVLLHGACMYHLHPFRATAKAERGHASENTVMIPNDYEPQETSTDFHCDSKPQMRQDQCCQERQRVAPRKEEDENRCRDVDQYICIATRIHWHQNLQSLTERAKSTCSRPAVL